MNYPAAHGGETRLQSNIPGRVVNRLSELFQARLLSIRKGSWLLVASAVVKSVRHGGVCI